MGQCAGGVVPQGSMAVVGHSAYGKEKEKTTLAATATVSDSTAGIWKRQSKCKHKAQTPPACSATRVKGSRTRVRTPPSPKLNYLTQRTSYLQRVLIRAAASSASFPHGSAVVQACPAVPRLTSWCSVQAVACWAQVVGGRSVYGNVGSVTAPSRW